MINKAAGSSRARVTMVRELALKKNCAQEQIFLQFRLDLLDLTLMLHLKYLAGYPPDTLTRVEELIADQRLGELLLKKYPQAHTFRTDTALYQYTQALKNRFMSKSPPLNRVGYDSKIKVIQHALGQHHFIGRVQGNKIKTVNEIKIASIFRVAPEAFLKMILVHELAHFKEKEHNKAFYQLCRHIEPDYHQYEFDLRLYLTQLELFGEIYS